MNKRITLPLVLLAATLAGCGASAAPGVEQAPGGGATATYVKPLAPPTPTTTTTAAVKPPPSLAAKPVVVVPHGPPPATLVTKDLVVGNGKTAKAGDTITVNYVGVLYQNGKEFDSSWSRNAPFTTALSSGGVIQGWVNGIQGMKIGGRRELIIPPNLAYGKSGAGSIPPNSTLVFVVDLLSIA